MDIQLIKLDDNKQLINFSVNNEKHIALEIRDDRYMYDKFDRIIYKLDNDNKSKVVRNITITGNNETFEQFVFEYIVDNDNDFRDSNNLEDVWVVKIKEFNDIEPKVKLIKGKRFIFKNDNNKSYCDTIIIDDKKISLNKNVHSYGKNCFPIYQDKNCKNEFYIIAKFEPIAKEYLKDYIDTYCEELEERKKQLSNSQDFLTTLIKRIKKIKV